MGHNNEHHDKCDIKWIASPLQSQDGFSHHSAPKHNLPSENSLDPENPLPGRIDDGELHLTPQFHRVRTFYVFH